MKTFALSSKLFYRNAWLLAAYGLFFGYIQWDFYQMLISMPRFHQSALAYLSNTLAMSIFCTIFFMLFGYLLFSKSQKAHLDECLAAIKGAKSRLIISQLALVVGLILLITLSTVAYNMLYPETNVHNADYIRHMFSSVFVYMFLSPLVGALLGLCVAQLKNSLVSYLLMILFAFLSSPLVSFLSYPLYDATHRQVNIESAFDIFNLYPLALDWAPNHVFGISLLPYKLEALCFWGLLALAIVLWKSSHRSERTARGLAVLCAVAGLVNLALFFTPSSKVDMSNRISGTLFGDQHFYSRYYDGKVPKEAAADFDVLQYNLDVRVRNQLSVTATLTIDKTDLPAYTFTLYRGYTVHQVLDQDGRALSFVQDVDHITVKPSAPVSSLRFTYSGFGERFYSNLQGVCLPGYFAYYPIAGRWNIMTQYGLEYTQNLLPHDTDFHVTVDYPHKIYTNLAADDTGGFTGKTNGLTLLSGFLTDTVIDGVEVVYPHFDTIEYSADLLRQKIEAFTKLNGSRAVKKILIVSDINQNTDAVVCYSDYITATYLSIIPDVYEVAKIPSRKQNLYQCQDAYMHDRDSFLDSVQYEKEVEVTDPPILYTTYQQKVNELGENKVAEKVTAYLHDQNDIRTDIEFLNDLH